MANMAEELSKRLMAKAEASWEQNGISDQERQVRRREIAKTRRASEPAANETGGFSTSARGNGISPLPLCSPR